MFYKLQSRLFKQKIINLFALPVTRFQLSNARNGRTDLQIIHHRNIIWSGLDSMYLQILSNIFTTHLFVYIYIEH